MREVKIFTLREIAPVLNDATDCPRNVMMTVGVGEQDEKLIGAVLRNDIAAPERLAHTLNEYLSRVLERRALIVASSFEREKNNANSLAVACAGTFEESINVSKTLERQNIRAGFLVA